MRILYRSSGGKQLTADAQVIEMLEGDKMKDFRQFIKDLIVRKKKAIEQDLGLLKNFQQFDGGNAE